MQYIKYKNEKIIHKEAVSEVLAEMDFRTQKRYKTKKIIEKAINIFCIIVFVALLSACIFTIAKMQGTDLGVYKGFYAVTSAFGSLFLPLSTALALVAILYGINGRFFKDINEVEIRSEIYKRQNGIKANKDRWRDFLSKYYGLGAEYLVTKCFYAYKNEFSGKEVCIFFNEGKLRIIYDFINRGKRAIRNDIGCIIIDLSKCTVSSSENEEFIKYGKYATVIREKNEVVALGSKASDFINGQLKSKV